ncbi:MAG TPA: hypothetical protein DCE41_28535 [Cytophagales bacterium]|nr:hypothetical protein [Cytophagales bacterium]HAA17789.1 hypothetical protein [Cytophagales bacterium]HAP59976.1 hypothetical protein [Cytophagales bacterium]
MIYQYPIAKTYSIAFEMFFREFLADSNCNSAIHTQQQAFPLKIFQFNFIKNTTQEHSFPIPPQNHAINSNSSV